jgi:hypothetical protein
LSGQTVQESVPLEFPAVKTSTRFLVQWQENTNRVIGTSEVWISPANLLAELNPLLNKATLGVLDPNDELKPLLRQNKVEFVDLGESSLDDFHGRLAILGPFHSKAQLPEDASVRCKKMAARGVSVVWMMPPSDPRTPLKPSFYTVFTETNAIVATQSEWMPGLADTPQSQQRLIELCRQAMRPVPPDLPEFNLNH